jgi:hypothetical protein
MGSSINGFRPQSPFDIAKDLNRISSDNGAKPFSGKLSNSQQNTLNQISNSENDPTKEKIQGGRDSASSSIKNAVDQVESARSTVAALRDQQAVIVETLSEDVESGSNGVNALEKLDELETEINRIKNISYSSGVSPFSSSTQSLGDDSRTSAGISVSAASSTYSLSAYTSGLSTLTATSADSLLSAAQTESFVTSQDAKSASRSSDTAEDLGVVEASKDSGNSEAAAKLSFEQAQELAGEISSQLIDKFGGSASGDIANSKLLEQTLSSVANIDVSRAAELLG